MAAKKDRISVVRVSRQTQNRVNPKEDYSPRETDAPAIVSRPSQEQHNKKGQNDIFRAKADVSVNNIPRFSIVKSADLNLQNGTSSRPSFTIQQQPGPTNNWVKRSSQHITRPELNWKPTGQWSHGLCSILHDSNMCCYACACWCCFRHEITTMMGEHWCLWFLNCTPLMELRTKFRQQYSIEGSIAQDCCLATFCPLCVALQLANEGRDRGHRIFN